MKADKNQNTTNKPVYDDTFRIAVQTKLGLIMIDSKSIIRCEARRSYCVFHLVGGQQVVVSRALKFYEDKLIEWNFFRVHKSNLVNIRHINQCSRGQKKVSILLSDNSEVSVASRKRRELIERLIFSAGFTDQPKLMAV